MSTLDSVQYTFESGNGSANAWRVTSHTFTEALNEPYVTTLELASDDPGADATLLLGHNATIQIVRGPFSRKVLGIVERVEHGETDRIGEARSASIVVVPALAALRHIVDTRVFQDRSVKQILDELLSETLGVYGRSVTMGDLEETYPQREICMQYRESTFDFVHRLMEEEGIGYRFGFDDAVEAMILTDRNGSFPEALRADDGPVTFTQRGDAPGEAVISFRAGRQQVSTSTVVRSFDWTAPLVPVEKPLPTTDAQGRDREVYDHGRELRAVEQSGAEFAPTDQNRQASLRRELAARDALVALGTSNVTGLMVGTKFALSGHTGPGVDGEYLVTRVAHRTSGSDYENEFECLPIAVPWRPARNHRRPRIQSIQTAKVVGVSSEEIHTDEHGRIRVQFPWDRQGGNDDGSMCWLRVNETWAGPGWGFVFTPRIGMEVVVNFVGGDPDRPVVTGCVYNGVNTPPYTLPGQKTKSTIKSNSSLGGEGFNELRFEDKAGEEEIFTHAQKDFNEEVLNDHNTHVVNNQTNTVDVNQTQTVHGNQTEQVDGNQNMTVDQGRTVHVKGAFEETIDSGETRKVKSSMTETISGGQTRTVNGGRTVKIKGGETRTVNGGLTETVNGGLTHTYNTNSTQNVSGSRTVNVTGNIKISSDSTYERIATAGSTITAAAGHNVLAPGGQRGVDKTFEAIGGVLNITYQDYFQVVINVQQAFVLRNALRGLDKRGTAMKVDVIHAKISNKPKDLSTRGACVVSGIVMLATAGFGSLG